MIPAATVIPMTTAPTQAMEAIIIMVATITAILVRRMITRQTILTAPAIQ